MSTDMLVPQNGVVQNRPVRAGGDALALRPCLVSLATALPPHILAQSDIADLAEDIFANTRGGFERYASIYENAAIAVRHSCVPLEWYRHEHDFAERNALYIENAVALLTRAANQALAEAHLKPQDIDILITVSSSGIATPSLDARLMQHLDFRADVTRLPIFGLGCAGGVLGLSRAAALAQSAPQSRVLLLVVELCGLTFRRQDDSKSNIVATALFADGAGAAVISCRDEGLCLGPWGEHTWPNSLDIMGWEITNDGFKVVFSRDIPFLVRDQLRPVVDDFLSRNDLSLQDIDGFICHPGGAKVIEALEKCFEIGQGSLQTARAVLNENGNMSAATILFVLRAALNEGIHGKQLITTLGPGFSAGFMIVEGLLPS